MLSKRSFAAPVGLVAVFVLAGARAQTHALTILHHERLANLEFVGAKDGTAVHDDADAESVGAHKPAALRAADATEPRIRFTAFGREFSAELEPNDRLLQGLAPKQRAALREIELYRGRLDGAPSSWIRLSRHGAEISGAIWDGFDLYGIEPAKRVRAALVAPAAETGHEPIIFRYRDTTGALTDKLIVRPTDESEPVALRAFATLGSTLPDISQLDIGLVADFKFFEYVGGETTPAMLDAINVADGIFVEQVGLHLNVAAIVVHEEEEDPFSGRDGQELLRDLEAYKGGTPPSRH